MPNIHLPCWPRPQRHPRPLPCGPISLTPGWYETHWPVASRPAETDAPLGQGRLARRNWDGDRKFQIATPYREAWFRRRVQTESDLRGGPLQAVARFLAVLPYTGPVQWLVGLARGLGV